MIDTAPDHDDILRLAAPNPGPMTLDGTNTYVVGRDPAYVIDPGPAVESHAEAVRAAAGERGGLAGALLTHSHADHSAGVSLLGAPLLWGEVSDLDEGAVLSRPHPAYSGQDSSGIGGEVGPFEVIPTPGHAADHVCFAIGEVVFCGDLVLGRGSSIVPPAAMGGSLAEYMASLERLLALEADLLCPGHGPWITDPQAKLEEYLAHRREREAKLVAALEAGERDGEKLLDAAWDDVPAPMRPAAMLAMEAHLEKLGGEGRLPPGVAD